MKQTFNFLKDKRFLIFNLFCLVMAVVTGGAYAMAIAEVEDGTEIAGADKDVNDMQAPGVDADGNLNMAGQDLQGTAASASQLRGGGLADEEYDEIIAKFRPFLFPLDTDIRKQAQQKKVTGYEVTHVQSGSSVLDCETTAEVTGGEQITLTKANISGKVAMFPAFSTILVQGVAGYAKGSKSKKQGHLVLYVVSNDGTNVTCEALNGPAKVAGDLEGGMTTPTIPAGTTLSCMANACSESQMIVSPDNFQPRTKKAYLQKKVLNTVFTDQFKQQMKKFPFFVEDVKSEALYNFRRKASRSAWLSWPAKFTVVDPKMGEELVYTQEGILNQLTMLLGAADEYDLKLLTAISMLMFTENASGNSARAYCGKNAIKRILHLKEVKTYKELGFESYNELGIEVHAYKDNFGKVEFVYDPTLDDLGYADFMVVVDIKNARRYVHTDNKEYTIDMKKGAGENREAERNVTIQADAIALKGYNSLLVGPSGMLESMNVADAATNVELVSVVPENPSDGQLIFLTAADADLSLEADKAYRWDAATGKWVAYTGAVAIA